MSAVFDLLPALTDRQLEVIAFINQHRRLEQCNPTCAEIANGFGWGSANAAYEHLKALERKGAIEYRRGKSRGYRVLRAFEAIETTGSAD